MTDPYAVLGVPRTASEDEIKAAYRKLAKQYHPDLHPGDEEAARKMNEINAAYDAIKNPQPQQQYAGSATGSSGGYDPFGFGFDPFSYGYAERREYHTQYETRDSTEIQSARHFVNAGAYDQALHVLSEVPVGDRDGQWYYLSSRANHGLGNRVAAMEHIRRAMQMEPENLSYQRFYQLLQAGGRVYTDTGTRYGYSNGFGGGYCNPFCTALCLANLCCGGGGGYWFCC